MKERSRPVVFTAHLKNRMKLRNIRRATVMEILARPDGVYRDRSTGHLVAVKQAPWGSAIRDMALVFREGREEIRIITLHPLKPNQKENRIHTGRWEKQPD